MDEIKVSVYCLAYNHEKFIRKTLDGFVNQITNFKYEVIVHDDASMDGTAQIIKEYEEKYPKIIKGIYQKENQYSQKIKIFDKYIYPLIRGKYIAMCEGDDYWTNNNKLQLQYDSLENNTDCSFCVHKTQKITEDDVLLNSFFPDIKIAEGVISSQRYVELELTKKPWLFQTSSYLFRKSVIEEFMKSSYRPLYPMGDLPMVLTGILNGNCYYINQNMSCYRINNNSTIGKLTKDKTKGIQFSKRVIEGHKEFNKYSNRRFSEYIEYSILNQEIQILKQEGRYREILATKYRPVLNDLNLKNKLLIFVGGILPGVADMLFNWARSKGRKM